MAQRNFLLVFCFTALALAGCSNAKEQLGLERKSPDEFAVVKRAPLAMPPSYSLRPPQPGAPRPQEQTTSQQARQDVFGQEAGVPAEIIQASSGENALLVKAGGLQADPDIRRKVDAETAVLHDRNKPVAERLLGIGGDKNEPSASVVNAKEESERIRKNMEEGKPVTEGETPYIEE